MLEVGILLTIVVVFAYLMVFLFHNGNHRHVKDQPAHPAVPEGATSTFSSSSVPPDDASCQSHQACAGEAGNATQLRRVVPIFLSGSPPFKSVVYCRAEALEDASTRVSTRRFTALVFLLLETIYFQTLRILACHAVIIVINPRGGGITRVFCCLRP